MVSPPSDSNATRSLRERRAQPTLFGYGDEPARATWAYCGPGFFLATGVGLLVFALLTWAGEIGLAPFLAVPACVGVLLGFFTRCGWWMRGLLAILACLIIVFALLSLDLSGVFCAVVGWGVAFGPTVLGATLGAAVRMALKHSQWSQRRLLPALLIASLPFGVATLERGFYSPLEPLTVTSVVELDVSREAAWRAFGYSGPLDESSEGLVALALGPLQGITGDATQPGSIVRYDYERGHVSKRVTDVTPGAFVAFEITEQDVHFERDVELLAGSLRFEGLSPQSVRLTLEICYQPLLRPRWLWAPLEGWVLRAHHDHLAAGIQARAETVSPAMVAGVLRVQPDAVVSPPVDRRLRSTTENTEQGESCLPARSGAFCRYFDL